MRFVLEILSRNTQCVSREFGFESEDASRVAATLSIPDFDSQAVYDLDETEVREIGRQFSLPLAGDELVGRLRPRYWYDDLPYRLHTNRELDLMLAGMKPLAAFSGEYPPNSEAREIPDELFDPYVAAGKFIKREFVEIRSFPGVRIHRVLYALPSEAWRIDAYILVLLTASKAGWNEALERIEGSLLGYEEWQNDAYLNAVRTLNPSG